ncbi:MULTISPECIES: hypothetical protein [Nocardia]|uniref:hypothetical protein n=1 Tax=Nocardia TaxID=1817 RepID=UPI002454F533|nr:MULTISPECIES: hypothetical protein [Nocardia]
MGGTAENGAQALMVFHGCGTRFSQDLAAFEVDFVHMPLRVFPRMGEWFGVAARHGQQRCLLPRGPCQLSIVPVRLRSGHAPMRIDQARKVLKYPAIETSGSIRPYFGGACEHSHDGGDVW